ncbi:hypothetical protein M0R45_016102 [Rubus argutus]|uniref:Uncharacterized protein n=1 Tax=Rubus argutus TaxID=59490 RepID=A0AAW1XR17_RUBAR
MVEKMGHRQREHGLGTGRRQDAEKDGVDGEGAASWIRVRGGEACGGRTGLVAGLGRGRRAACSVDGEEMMNPVERTSPRGSKFEHGLEMVTGRTRVRRLQWADLVSTVATGWRSGSWALVNP